MGVGALSVSEFVAQAARFLESAAEPKVERDRAWGEGSDSVALWSERTPDDDREIVAAARAWKAREFDAGFGWICGPVEYGGAGHPETFLRAYERLKRGYEVPDQSPLHIGTGMIGPTLLAHGTETAKESYLRSIWRGDTVACQLFSEPDAGSDLAGVTTRATRDGDSWVLTGEKVWTSGAHYSDIGEVLARSSSDNGRHRNLTAFVVDMKAPGVEVRPLRQMTGGASFNAVSLNEVVVPDEMRLGAVHEGWRVALTTLMNERASISAGRAGGGTGTVSLLFQLAAARGAGRDPVVRQALAAVHIGLAVARWNAQRGMARMAAGQTPGPEMSLGKLSLVANQARIEEAVTRILGPALTADTGEWGTYSWSKFVLGRPGVRLAGGTDEVMRNILAERVLGLPRD